MSELMLKIVNLGKKPKDEKKPSDTTRILDMLQAKMPEAAPIPEYDEDLEAEDEEVGDDEDAAAQSERREARLAARRRIRKQSPGT